MRKPTKALIAVLLCGAVSVNGDVVRTRGGGSGSGIAPGTVFVGQIVAPAADNCTSPPYSFSGDLNTGVCTATADNLSLRTAGVNQLTVNATAVTSTVPMVLPVGTVATAPSLTFTGFTNTGFSTASGVLDLSIVGTHRTRTNANGVIVNGRLELGANPLGGDVFLSRENTAILQLGADVNGAATAQEIKSHDGITGTDVAGADFTHSGGRGTGAGAPGDFLVRTATPLATGTTAQTLTTRQHVRAPFRALTDATATTIFTIGTGNDVSCGGTVFFTVEAADAANQQSTTGSANFAAADNAAGAGGEACTAAVTGTNASAATSGTLTVTSDATTGTDLCNIRLTATGSLTETVGPRVRYTVVLNPMSSSCTITPQ